MGVFLFLGIVLGGPIATTATEVSPEGVLSAYFEDARAENWDRAAAWWLSEDVARATRLGIDYRDIPFKLDCSSYLLMPAVRRGGETTIGAPVGDEGTGPLRYRVNFSLGSETANSDYVLIRDGDRWVLAAPTTALGRDWPQTESRYLRFHVQPGQDLHPPAIGYLDDFVAWCAARLGLSEDRMGLLAEAKLDYLLCAEEVVEAIAGAPTRGVSVLPVDAVVTGEPAHTHELAHLLVGFAAQELGMYVLPALQEGIAVHLGGRWGRSRQVQEELGRYVLQSGFVEVDGFLSWSDFRNELPDLVYAPAGILAGYLLDELGPAGFLDLYRDYSGWSVDLAAASSADIQADLETRLGLESGGLDAALKAYGSKLPGGGIEPGEGPPGETSVELDGGGLKAIITTGEMWVTFNIAADQGEPAGALMLGSAGESRQAGRLFAERFPGRDYRGERGAVLFHGREAGYYDFSVDVLTAKYVHDFRPDPAYLSAEGNALVFRIRRNLLPHDLSEINLVPSR